MSDASDVGQSDCRLTRRQHAVLWLVFVVALALRLTYLWGQAVNNPRFYSPTMDPGIHHTWAQQIAAGAGMDPRPYFRAPLYYYLLAGLYKLAGPNVLAGRIAGCVLGALTCYLIARAGVRLAGFAAGMLAGLLAACYWPLIYYDAELLTVGLEVFLNVAMWLLLLRAARSGRLLLFLAAGVVWGLSAITRPNVLALAPAILLWPWVAERGGVQPLRRFRAALLMVLGATAAILPVTIRNWVVGGEPVLIATNGGVNFYIGNNPQSDGYSAIVPGTRASWEGGYIDTHRIPEREAGHPLSERAVSDYWFTKALQWIRSEPAAWLTLLFEKFRLFWSPVEIPNNQPIWFYARLSGVSALFWLGFPVIVGPGIAGLLLVLPRWRRWFIPLTFLLIYMATVVLFFCPARYRIPVVPVLIFGVAAGLVRGIELVRTGRRMPVVLCVLIGILCTLAVATNPPDPRKFDAQCDSVGHFQLGTFYASTEAGHAPEYARAIEHLEKSLSLRPGHASTQRALATCRLEMGQWDEAGRAFSAAVADHPEDAEAREDYASYLVLTGEWEDGISQFKAALERQPWLIETHLRLGIALAQVGRQADAAEQFRAALQLQPDLAEARERLDAALARSAKATEAVAAARRALEAEPGSSRAALALAGVLTQLGRFDEALGVVRGALAQSPDDLQLNDTLGWLLATAPERSLRNGAEAMRQALKVRSLAEHSYVETLDTLAAAYAETGRFEQAVEAARRALEQARTAKATGLAERIEARLRLYEHDRPYHGGSR